MSGENSRGGVGPPSKEDLERLKLTVETSLLQQQLGPLGIVVRLAVPVVSVVLTLVLGLLAWENSRLSLTLQSTSQSKDDDARKLQTLERYFEWATAEQTQTERRATGITLLGDYWGEGQDRAIAETLVVMLPDSSVRQNVLGSLERGIMDECRRSGAPRRSAPHIGRGERSEVVRERAALLYGDSRTGDWGVVLKLHHRLLAQRPRTELLDWTSPQVCRKGLQASATELEQAITASVEAIRKNWECLDGAYLVKADLSFGDFYDANLAGADLRSADLRAVDFTGVDLRDAKYDGAIPCFANIADASMDNELREFMLSRWAVNADEAEWRLWRDAGFPLPKNWVAWQRAGFPLTMGNPVEPVAHR